MIHSLSKVFQSFSKIFQSSKLFAQPNKTDSGSHWMKNNFSTKNSKKLASQITIVHCEIELI